MKLPDKLLSWFLIALACIHVGIMVHMMLTAWSIING